MHLKSYLQQHKISAAEFGPRVGVHNRQTMWRYAVGERMPPPKVMQAIERETSGEVTASECVALCCAWSPKQDQAPA